MSSCHEAWATYAAWRMRSGQSGSYGTTALGRISAMSNGDREDAEPSVPADASADVRGSTVVPWRGGPRAK
jgi:hypothetical protein